MEIVQGAIGSFLIAFPALFSIVNPPGGALIYHQVTADRGHAERVRLAWRVALYSRANARDQRDQCAGRRERRDSPRAARACAP
jgi:hypothetical protein